MSWGQHLEHRLTAEAIRAAKLPRVLRGYDPDATEHLLADAADALDALAGERTELSSRFAKICDEQEQRQRQAEQEFTELRSRIDDRDRRLVQYEAEIERVEQERARLAEEVQRLEAALAEAPPAGETVETVESGERDQALIAQHLETIRRLETREKALVEQVAMLQKQLERMQQTEAPAEPIAERPPQQRVVESVAVDERTGVALRRLDRILGAIEEDARRDAEVALKKARERADEIVQEAQAVPKRAREEADQLVREAHRALTKAHQQADEIIRSADAKRREIEQEVARLTNLAEQLRESYRAVAAVLQPVAIGSAGPTTEAAPPPEADPPTPAPHDLVTHLRPFTSDTVQPAPQHRAGDADG